MDAFNQSKSVVIASNVERATSTLARMKGLLGKKSMDRGYGLWIVPCKSIHTFFMKFPIDVLFLSPTNRVVKLMESVQPFRISSWVSSAQSVLELEAHTIQNTNIAVGDQVIFRL